MLTRDEKRVCPDTADTSGVLRRCLSRCVRVLPLSAASTDRTNAPPPALHISSTPLQANADSDRVVELPSVVGVEGDNHGQNIVTGEHAISW